MKKPALLRAALAAFLPDLARDPDRLAMWVEKGKVSARLGPQRGFAWEYDLTVLIDAYTGDPSVLMFVICDWLRAQQPDLLASGAEGFPFEVDVLDEKTVDVQITLSLKEVVRAEPGPGGRWELVAVPEPAPMLSDTQALGPALTSIWADGQQLAPLPLD